MGGLRLPRIGYQEGQSRRSNPGANRKASSRPKERKKPHLPNPPPKYTGPSKAMRAQTKSLLPPLTCTPAGLLPLLSLPQHRTIAHRIALVRRQSHTAEVIPLPPPLLPPLLLSQRMKRRPCHEHSAAAAGHHHRDTGLGHLPVLVCARMS